MPLNQPKHKKAEPSSASRRSLIKSTAAAALFTALGTNYAHAQGTDRIKVGLVGCGGRGRGAAGNIAEADPKGVSITAIADAKYSQWPALRSNRKCGNGSDTDSFSKSVV